MTAILDAPTIAPVILDETILDDVATCSKCDQPAEYLIRNTCCNRRMLVCGSCETRCNSRWSMQIIVDGSMACTGCRKEFVDVDAAVKVRPV